MDTVFVVHDSPKAQGPAPNSVTHRPESADRTSVTMISLRAKPWMALQGLGVLMMLHAAGLLLWMGDDAAANREALGWAFLSLGILGFLVSAAARSWLGCSAIAWSSGMTLFGSLALLALAPPEQRVVSLAVALVVLGIGLTHWAGALRLRRQEQRYRPYLCSGAVNIAVAAVVMLQVHANTGYPVCALVAGATFTSGLTLYHYGRLLRRLASTGASMMDLLHKAVVPRVRHSKARL